MTNTAFVLKLLKRNFDELTPGEMLVIADNPDVFKMPKKFKKLLDGADFTEEKRSTAIRMLEDEFPQSIFLLNKFNQFSVADPVYGIEFKKDFIDIARRLPIYRLCILIDKLNYYMRKCKICFFGNNQAKPNVWHEINRVVSEAFGCKLVFSVFGYKEHYYRFEKLNYQAINAGRLIECLDTYCKNWTCILYHIAKVLADADEETVGKKKGVTGAINKAVQIYADIIKTEHKALGNVERDQEGILSADILD